MMECFTILACARPRKKCVAVAGSQGPEPMGATGTLLARGRSLRGGQDSEQAFIGLVAWKTLNYLCTDVTHAPPRKKRPDISMPLCSITSWGLPWSRSVWMSLILLPPQTMGTATSLWLWNIFTTWPQVGGPPPESFYHSRAASVNNVTLV